jgi:tripartite-type tricarboxylate transporter receptor subunit TctC
MKISRRRMLQLAAATVSAPARAQDYPSRPITIVVPFAAGGPLDAMARIMADRMRLPLGQTLLIENVVGAAGSIGVGRVARATPDGYTISIGHWSTHVVNGAIYDLSYDLLRDFEPIVLLPANPLLIVSKKSVPAENLTEFITWIKANGSKISAGNAGVGSASHIGEVYFQKITNTRFQLVPYRGTGPALNDLVAEQIDMIVDQASNSMNQVRTGTIKAYAVTASARIPSAPEIPSVDEAGLAGLHMSVWYGFWAPKGTSRTIITKLNGAAVAAMADPVVRGRMADLGLEIPPREQQSPEALGKLQKAEIDKWWPIIKAAGIKAD